MLGSREGMGGGADVDGGEESRAPAPARSASGRPAAQKPATNVADMDDDIPF